MEHEQDSATSTGPVVVTAPGGLVRRVRTSPSYQAVSRRLRPLGYKETHLQRALDVRGADTYLEIGVRTGECLRRVRAARKIGVDPVRAGLMLDLRRGELMLQMTSDEFFDTEAAALLAERPVDVALVDGLHHAEQALRDLLHLERWMAPGGVVFLHDCNPTTPARADRVPPGVGSWNGDVWKVAVYLARARPDLDFTCFDCDEGLLAVRGFTPDPPPLDAAALQAALELGYADLERDRSAVLRLRPPSDAAAWVAVRRGA